MKNFVFIANYILLILVLTLLLLSACHKKEEDNSVPVLSTIPASNINQHSALSGGQIISDGGFTILSKGICWSEQQMPTILSNKTENSQGLVDFICNVEGLESNKSYYIRAYATNKNGIGYGSVVSFSTIPEVLSAVTTNNVFNISYSTCVCGGNITNDGGSLIIEKGVCYGTESNPSITDLRTRDGAGSGEFISSISKLYVNTTYYIKAYATNAVGTSYGNEMTFKTFYAVNDIDGNTYTTVTLNGDAWFKENLKVTRYRNGTEIELVTDVNDWTSNEAPGYCWYQNDKEIFGNIYGALYNHYAARTDSLCPIGWHVATNEEWFGLYFYDNGELKEAGYDNWNQPNTAASNSTGFAGLPGGQRREDFFGNNGFGNLGYYGNWWVKDGESSAGYVFTLGYNTRYLSRDFMDSFSGYSVRCVED